ncbi:MAG: hypothetical protein H6765_06260 [Candidatus Peribacteria bacterium]|nr:MAG: hypothetical protein H6765_06260 [Candidatus Peribacteria bacterium]
MDGPDHVYKITIIGMSSVTGNPEKNEVLAEKRAALAQQYFDDNFERILQEKLNEQGVNIPAEEFLIKLAVQQTTEANS